MKFLLSLLALLVTVSWYGNESCLNKKVCRTASGEVYNKENLTAACWKEYKLGTKFEVNYQGKTIIIRCNDRGGFKKYSRFLDLSEGSFKSLAPLSKGLINVEVNQL